MKVVHLSSSDLGGGAALAAFRLHSGLRRDGVNSRMIVARKSGDDPTVSAPISRAMVSLCERLDRQPRRLLRTTNPSHISPAWIGTSAWKHAERECAELTHLHWVNKGFISVESLRRFRTPLIWSLHDMWAFSGGEHYVGTCERYLRGYRPDNRPEFESGFDLNRWIWERKLRAWRTLPHLTVLCVSEWLADRARESVLFRDRPVEVLHNALDPTVFAPSDITAARAATGLPAGRPLVLFGAIDATTDKRKGLDLLIDALRELRGRGTDLELVVFGDEPKHAASATLNLGFPTHYLGRIDDPRRLATIYASCNVMVVPSREESFGQTALEALACGTPVVAFRVGGLPEIVEHETSGFLARPFDRTELADGIAWIISRDAPGRSRQLGAAGRKRVLDAFTLESQARRCRNFYEAALERARRRPVQTA